MQLPRKAVLVGLATSLWAFEVMSPAPVVASTIETYPIDTATCARIRAAIVGDTESTSDTDRDLVAAGTDDECTVTVTETVTPSDGDDLSIASAGVACGNWYRNQDVVYGGWMTVASGKVNVGMCWNGSRVWVKWGPDCSVWTLPAFGWGVSWCGVWNNGGRRADPGSNWYFFEHQTPWYRYEHWMRFEVYSNGNSTGVWGR